ncbi:hypothetical protein [Pontibacter silvestris]|uniref:hypothetical protein n=1 Tax=Pontibacter silvestris TaxID=2305183 RepID=UPI001E2DB062|nr:hypothetical protein [Pontibacter silvestris]MCC9138425.1 hypothetical protein [Pontibacter silvestris]
MRIQKAKQQAVVGANGAKRVVEQKQLFQVGKRARDIALAFLVALFGLATFDWRLLIGRFI